MIKQLKETVIPQRYSTSLYTEGCYDFAQEHTDKVLDVLVSGAISCLADIKSKDVPVAFEFSETNGNFLMAFVVKFFENEDKKMPGHWDVFGTFDEKDIPENARIAQPYDTQYYNYFRAIGGKKYTMGFEQCEYMADMFKFLVRTIRQWLDENASESEVVGVTMDGVVTFKVAIENGEKVMSVELPGEIKQLVKDDAATN